MEKPTPQQMGQHRAMAHAFVDWLSAVDFEDDDDETGVVLTSGALDRIRALAGSPVDGPSGALITGAGIAMYNLLWVIREETGWSREDAVIAWREAIDDLDDD